MQNNKKKIAIIIGAGPAGLTAAHELVKKTDIKPIIFEIDGQVGGLSKTVNYKGNRIDIGGHRFFSKVNEINDFWVNVLPLQNRPAKDDLILNRQINLSEKQKNIVDPEKTDKVMLLRSRLSRIFFLRKFFNYPISLSLNTFLNLGFFRVFKIGFSYIKIRIFPIKKEISLQDFFINRFGKELYKTFFKDYTEKVWGVPCDKISASWGAQRVKGLSITKAVFHAIKSIFSSKKYKEQKKIETSLISKFMYPKLGPGQMWEEVAKEVVNSGGEIKLKHEVVKIFSEEKNITKISFKNLETGEISEISADYFFSSMPVKDLVAGFDSNIPSEVLSVSKGLIYRDFITVGLLLKKMKIKNKTKIKTLNNIVPDNWIYIQERDVKVGRVQVFNNWSPYMVKDLDNVWIGLEYFCQQGDELWNKPNEEFISMAINELCKIGFIEKEDVLDSTVIKVPKAYPAYFGSYDRFNEIKRFINKYENLFLIGRNGMHRYNNMDHSMLTAITAVQNIIDGKKDKSNIWAVNSEEEYHEEKCADSQDPSTGSSLRQRLRTPHAGRADCEEKS